MLWKLLYLVEHCRAFEAINRQTKTFFFLHKKHASLCLEKDVFRLANPDSTLKPKDVYLFRPNRFRTSRKDHDVITRLQTSSNPVCEGVFNTQLLVFLQHHKIILIFVYNSGLVHAQSVHITFTIIRKNRRLSLTSLRSACYLVGIAQRLINQKSTKLNKLKICKFYLFNIVCFCFIFLFYLVLTV